MRKGGSSASIERTERSLVALCLQLTKTRAIESTIMNDLSFAKALAYRLEPSEIDLDRALSRLLDIDKARSLQVSFSSDAAAYLQATYLLVECLFADCYVTKSTREQVLNGLLAETAQGDAT